MAQDGIPRLEQLFREAIDLSPAQRAEYLARACGDDAGLRAEVETLIRHHEEAGTAFLRPVDWRGDPNAAQPASPAGGPSPGAAGSPPAENRAAADSPGAGPNPPVAPNPPGDPNPPLAPSPRVGASPAGAQGRPPGGDAPAETVAAPKSPPRGHGPSIEGYEIIKELHRGGQGIVYQAIQKSTKRKVAIKILLEGPYASKAARRRFEREIELVAQLRHPNIVEVFHSGETSDGRQYAVMDYVRGKPLDQYLKEKKPTLEEALALFTTICEAVNYAHQRGVIHRDLKPSNILVDHEGHPKVLDFGLAKQMAGPEASLVSMTGQVVGTLPYMSPEQARGNPDEIDIRTDVYALGVILYEMLTGAYPYPVVGQMAEVLKHIAHTPPTPPSRTWKSGSGVTQRTHKRLRIGACPIDDEVQTIVLRSLTKERDRRYQSAGELARDVEHYLKDEPIEAKKDSRLYLLKTAIKRNKVPFGITAAFVVLLAGFGVGMGILADQNKRLAIRIGETAEKEKLARVDAETQRDRAEQEKQRADEKATEAQRERLLAESAAVLNTDPALSLLYRINAYKLAQSTSANNTILSTMFALRELRALTGHSDRLQTVAFSPAGDQVLTVSRDNTARLWAVAGNSGPRVLPHKSAVLCGTYCPDGSMVSTGGCDHVVRVWNARTGETLRELPVGDGELVFSIAFSPNSHRIAAGTYKKLYVWTLEGEENDLVNSEEGLNTISRVVFSPDGRHLLSSSLDGVLRIWDATTGAEIAILRGHEKQDQSGDRRDLFWCDYSPDGKLIVSAGADGTARIWSTDDFRELAVFSQYSTVVSANFSRDGRRLVTASFDGTACVWDVDSLKLLIRYQGHGGRIFWAEFNMEGNAIVSASDDGTARVWDAFNGRTLEILRGHTDFVLHATFSPDGRLVATASVDKTARIWNLEPYGSIRDTRDVPSSLYDCVSDDEALVVADLQAKRKLIIEPSNRRNSTVSLLDAISERTIAVLRHDAKINHAAFSADGRLVVTVSGTSDVSPFFRGELLTTSDNTARVWNAESGRLLRQLAGHRLAVTFAAFSADGRYLVTASLDKTAKIWKVESWTEWMSIPLEDAIDNAVFSSNSAYLFTHARNAQVHRWDVDVLRAAIDRKPRELTTEERIRVDLNSKMNVASAPAQER